MDGELDPLVAAPQIGQTQLPRTQAWNLYTSHALSTWNIRTYEFGAILFTATAFPDTLLASSLRGLSNTLVALCLSSSIGNWIDQSPSRLGTLLSTISANRASVILACLGWVFLLQNSESGHDAATVSGTRLSASQGVRLWLFAVVVSLGICEKLSGIGNMICMERDWVPTLASTSTARMPGIYDLTHMNAVMRRIDLICKLVAPLVISVIISSTSMRTGVVVVAGMSGLSWVFEVYCARRVWLQSPVLRASRQRSTEPAPVSNHAVGGFFVATSYQSSRRFCLGYTRQIVSYFSTDVWIPSLSLALLHLSVLSYSATFVTFLLNSGFSLLVITIARALGSIVEVSSTFIAPIGIHYLSMSKQEMGHVEDQEQLLNDHEMRAQKQHATGLARSGLWGITLQLGNLLPVVLAIWYLQQPQDHTIPSTLLSRFIALTTSFTSRPFAAVAMFTFLSISRLGLWVYDLTTQEITQTCVSAEHRSSFAGTEMAFVSLFELSQWIVAAVISKPEDFRWLALMSFGAVFLSTCMYALWVRKQRGHLMHWDRLGKGCYRPKP